MAYKMTARRRAALKKAQLASARKRRKNKRIDRRVKRVRNRTNKRVRKQASIAERNAFTHSTQGGLYFNKRGVKAMRKGAKTHLRGQAKIKRLKSKKRR